MAEEQQEPTAEAIKQRKKREKDAAKKAALGIEKFTVEVAGVFKPDLKRLMKEHGFNNPQEVYQNLLRNVIAADFDTAARMLRCVMTPFVITEEVSREFRNESLRELCKMPGEPQDEIIEPFTRLEAAQRGQSALVVEQDHTSHIEA
jgi:chemotaxis methyl-accepting protein methylase